MDETPDPDELALVTPSDPRVAKSRRLASEALSYARQGKWAAAGAAMQAVYDQHGELGLETMMMGLVDTVVSVMGRPQPGTVVMPMWFDTTDGQFGTADEVPPRVRWAGQLIAARAADDPDGFYALVHSFSSDAEFSDRMAALLEVVAETLNMRTGRG